MITSVSILTLLVVLSSLKTLNPMKLIFSMGILSSLVFFTLNMKMTMTWITLLLFMLFMGGILISFMMIASLMPNEKSMNFKPTHLVLMILALMIPFNFQANESEIFYTKSSLMADMNLALLTITMLLYFLIFIEILTQTKSPLRTSFCYKIKCFCNTPSKVAMKIFRNENILVTIMNKSLWDLPSPSSMTYFWNFGSTLGLCLAVQIATGLLLTFHYTSYASESFSSIVEIMREVWSGWIIRFIHMNGASMFFVFVYLHLFRGLFYLSSTHKKVWNSGVSILLLLMAISFLGYVLPWGQMSYWAVAVITNLFSVIPMIGPNLVNWIWGGFSVGSPTLTRFYSLHFLLPFILSFLVIIHLLVLHVEGSSNSMGLNSNIDKVEFHPYFSTKDLSFIVAALITFICISFYYPYILGDPVNNVPANSMQTPIHIQPEWYFLPSYAILRALPSKTAGVVALALSVSIFFILPLYKFEFSTKFSSFRILNFWTILFSFLFLMKMGALPAEEPYIEMSKWGAITYFSSILILNA